MRMPEEMHSNLGSPMENLFFTESAWGCVANDKDMLKRKNYLVSSKKCFTFATNKKTKCLTIKIYDYGNNESKT